jgi:hypothetical protein
LSTFRVRYSPRFFQQPVPDFLPLQEADHVRLIDWLQLDLVAQLGCLSLRLSDELPSAVR